MQLSRPKIIATLLAIASAGALLAWWLIFSSTPSLSQRETATRGLAEYLQNKLRPSTVLVIGNPFSQTSGRSTEIYSYQTAGVEGLRKGFSERTQLKVDFPELKPQALQDPGSIPIDSESKTPLSFFVTDQAFDQLLRKHEKIDVIVSLIGLPVNLRAVESWTKPGAPAYALLLPDWRMIGSKEAILQAFRSEKLAAAVVDKPGAPPQDRIKGKTFREVFDASFILVTAENIEQLLTQQPETFGLK